MLVYTRVDSELDSTNLGDPDSWSLQPHIKRTVDDKNDEHESFVHNMKLSKVITIIISIVLVYTARIGVKSPFTPAVGYYYYCGKIPKLY
jgi:hypothetical protein